MRTMRLHSDMMVNDIVDLCRIVPENSIGIEIGCFMGESSQLFAQSGKFNKLYCVDPWEQGYYKSHDMHEIEKHFDSRAKQHHEIVKVKAKSDSITLIEDNSINFIYIDGNHSYEFVKNDIINSLAVLRKSKSTKEKLLCGHDYKFKKSPGVEKAVKELLGYPDIRFAGYSWAKILR